jgi:hypothetical protein
MIKVLTESFPNGF